MVVEQGRDVGVDDQDDVATAAAVAAVRATEGLELLAVDGGAAVTTIAGSNVQDDLVDERRHAGRASFTKVRGRAG